MTKAIATLATILMFSLNVSAESKSGRDYTVDRTPTVPVILDLEGTVRSAGTHTKDECPDLEFVDSKTGKKFDLERAEELTKLHCASERDLVVRMTAEKESRFLFWGGDLIVKSFEVISETPSESHIVESRPASTSRFSERR